jgi:hypothetical protein
MKKSLLGEKVVNLLQTANIPTPSVLDKRSAASRREGYPAKELSPRANLKPFRRGIRRIGHCRGRQEIRQVHHQHCLSPHLRLMPGLPLTQNWIGKGFVHAILGPYLQRCGNKLRVFICIDIEHLAPTHANNVNAVVVIG